MRYFVRVAESLNFRAAAAALNVSAPALSRQVRDLEEELGARLLERNTQTVRLTNAGRVYLEEAGKILAQVKQAANYVREAESGRRGHLRIGTIGRRLGPELPRCLGAFQERFPDVAVELLELDYAEQAEALRAGRIEVGFMPRHALPESGTGFQAETVLSRPIFALVGRKHPLAGARAVALAEVARERLLFLGKHKASMSADYARELFSARGLAPGKICEVKGFPILLAMVASEQGVSLMGFGALATETGEVVLRPLRETGPDLTLEFCAVYPRAGRGPEEPVRHFLDMLRAVTGSKSRSSRRKRK